MSKKRNVIGSRLYRNRRKRLKKLKKIKKVISIIAGISVLISLIYCIILLATGGNQQKIAVGEDSSSIHAIPQKNTGSDSVNNEMKQTPDPKKEREADQTKIEGKKVYLTFDDGPSQNTEKILNILDQYNAKATFFVIGKTDDFSKQMYKQIYEKGHTLAMHSYTHKYDKIYKSVDAYKKDLTQLSDLLFDVTGERPKYLRFPGGSSNTVNKIGMKNIIRYVDAKGLTYFDWNVINGDATGKKLTEKEMVKNVISGVNIYNNAIVLMHDGTGKEMTVKTLPTVLKKLKKMKVNILPINDTTVPVQHLQVEKVREK